jgi:tetratricopeptide (TPR) repeat protein
VALGDYYRSVPGDNRRSLAAFESGLELAPTNVDLLGGAGLAEQALGRWEASLQHLRRAAELDPRSALSAQRTASTLLLLRRFPEAQAEAERGLALAPTNLAMTFLRALVAIGQGDLAGAQAVVRAALPRVDPDALLAFFGTIEDLYWVLDDAQQRRLLTLPPSVYDGDRGTWAIVRAQTGCGGIRRRRGCMGTRLSSCSLTSSGSPLGMRGMSNGAWPLLTWVERPRPFRKGSGG